jgi:hypothetical protein
MTLLTGRAGPVGVTAEPLTGGLSALLTATAVLLFAALPAAVDGSGSRERGQALIDDGEPNIDVHSINDERRRQPERAATRAKQQ